MAAILERIAHAPTLSDDLAEIVAKVQRSVVLVRGSRGSGSGVIWSSAGTIVTNHHVVDGSTAEIILGSDPRTGAPRSGRDSVRFMARVTRRSERRDLAVLVPESPLEFELEAATVRDSADLRAGEIVLAIGNPLGERNVATLGLLITAPDSPDSALRAAVTLRPGNSGGALTDAEGRVVGIPHMVWRGGLAQAVSTRAVQQFLRDG